MPRAKKKQAAKKPKLPEGSEGEQLSKAEREEKLAVYLGDFDKKGEKNQHSLIIRGIMLFICFNSLDKNSLAQRLRLPDYM